MVEVPESMKNRIRDTMASSIYAIYDYSVSPITFDFLQFLECAEMVRRKAGFKQLFFLLVLDDNGKFRTRTNKDESLSFEQKMWRVRQIHIPSCWLLKSCAQVSFFADRAEFARTIMGIPQSRIYHPKYSIENPQVPIAPAHMFDVWKGTQESPLVFSATDAALENVNSWLQTYSIDPTRMVSLTVRKSTLEADRNGDQEAWSRFADMLKAEGYQPVFVPDTDQVFKERSDEFQPNHTVFWPGATNLELRTALYERAHICMSDNGAAAWIHQWMPNSNPITFQPPNKVPVALRDHDRQEKSHGIKRGEQYPFFTPTQWFCWENDDYDVILGEFRKMEAAVAAKRSEA